MINRKIYEFSKQKISECQINPKVVRKSQNVKKIQKLLLRYFDELVNYSFILIVLIADDLELIVLNKICAMNDPLNFCLKREMW